MPGHPRVPSFIRYELPVLIAGKPTKPQEEQGGKGKPRPITTLAVGEEGSSNLQLLDEEERLSSS
ncbi:MAG TPA: hypothetical protein VNA24_27055 [Hyalangium sp.]|jgi:hypothetical protein|nr:hypothetical protein [Hyalangium sp.]